MRGPFWRAVIMGMERSMGEDGNLYYEGNFCAGKKSGEGTLYHPDTGMKMYEGGFRSDFYDGRGRLYDARGNLLYDGEFLLGNMNGEGTLYNSVTGEVVEEGIFRNGILVTPARPEEPQPSAEEQPEEHAGTAA